jgi:beta-lactamase superfamily II metal-dependent hydrolase
MAFNGIELDIFKVDNADCILISRWINGTVCRVLVDGAHAKDVPMIKRHLVHLNACDIDHVVCSHPHSDHAEGLLELLKDNDIKIGNVWIHKPFEYVSVQELTEKINKSASFAKMIKPTIEYYGTSIEIARAAKDRGIIAQEPFADSEIGFLTVCSPTASRYQELIQLMHDEKTMGEVLEEQTKFASEEPDELVEKAISTSTVLDTVSDDSPIHASCTVLTTSFENKTYVLTSDALESSLTAAKDSYELKDVFYFQIPHHGSRQNINTDLINHFKPTRAFASAKGSRKHPRRAVVNAFKAVGSKVYSTHYLGGAHLWHHQGDVPERTGYSSAYPLWDKP